jgi:hypothetical protein
MTLNNPLIPLSPAAFRLALRKGQGRALLHINQFGVTNIEHHLIEACTTCVAYDAQCEGMREEWLFTLVEKAQLQDSVLRAIVEAEQKISTNESHWDRKQRSAILKKMALSGSIEARKILYATLATPTDDGQLRSAEDIIALDGIEGLLKVTRRAGQQISEDPEFWVDEYYIRCCDEPLEVAQAILQTEAESDEDIKRFLAYVNQASSSRMLTSTPSPMQDFSAKQILEHLQSNPTDPCHWLRSWGKNAKEVERNQIFTALLLSNKPEQVIRLFKCFARISIPCFDDRLLKWAIHPDEKLQWAAVKALQQLTHLKLRSTAIHLIDNGKLAHGISLLINNFQPGDFAMIAGYLDVIADEDEIHRIIGQILDLYDGHPSFESINCLFFVYEHSPCSLCRFRAFKALLECCVAPVWIIEEAISDVDPKTRTLASDTAQLSTH